MNEETRYILLNAAFETWKFQIDSYWTRMSHFAVFELAFAAGLWKTFDTKHYFTSAGIAVGAIALTIIWIINNSRLHGYILFYWSRMEHYENLLLLAPEDSIVQHFKNHPPVKRIPGEYHIYIQIIPGIFLLGWFWMFCWSICEIRHAMNLC
jgi:hypothetical protein